MCSANVLFVAELFVDLVVRNQEGEEGEWGPSVRRAEQVAFAICR